MKPRLKALLETVLKALLKLYVCDLTFICFWVLTLVSSACLWVLRLGEGLLSER